MIRRLIICCVLLQLVGAPYAVAQIAKIIEVKGSVSVRKTQRSNWQRAAVDMYLEGESEIKTEQNSHCMVSFDEELENILTIQENSHIRIESLRPGEIFLPKGRVFSLIDDLAKLDEFQVRTPVAIVGVRGTGDSVEHGDQGTLVQCFEGRVQALLLGPRGRITGRRMLMEGRGIDVDTRGRLRDEFDIPDFERHQWNQFRSRVDERRQEHGHMAPSGGEPPLDAYRSEPKPLIDERFLLDADEPAWQPGATDYRRPRPSSEQQYPDAQEHHDQPSYPEPHPDQEHYPDGSPDEHTDEPVEHHPEASDETLLYIAPGLKQEQIDSFRDDMLLDRRIDRDSGGGYP